MLQGGAAALGTKVVSRAKDTSHAQSSRRGEGAVVDVVLVLMLVLVDGREGEWEHDTRYAKVKRARATAVHDDAS